MTRRVQTLITAGVLFVVLLVLAISLPVPYVVLGPGPTLNTLAQAEGSDIISVSGGPTQTTRGHLNLTTVSVSGGRVTLVQAMWGWLKHDEVVVPREAVYPPGQTQDQVDQQNAEDFTDSQNSAEGAAFCELGYTKGFGILATSTSVKPAGAVRSGDQLLTVNGTVVSDDASLKAALNRFKAGDQVKLGIARSTKPQTVTVTLSAPLANSGSSTPRIGIAVGTTCFAPYTVKIGLNNEIGGPSAGTMFALGIIDKIGKQDLTGGRFIAGTGTITAAGVVGPIGGIQLKMIAARRAGATLFLAPASNCSDVRGNIPKGLTVARMSTLKQAVQILQTTKSGGQVAGC